MALKIFPLIKLYRGATTVVTLDLTDFDLRGGLILFSVEDENDELVFTQELTTNEPHEVIFSDEFTYSLIDDTYSYDIMWVIGNSRYPQCLKSPIKVYDTVGGYRGNGEGD